METEIAEILSSGGLCVLCTHDGEKPHCSLMRYVTDDSGLELYLLTPKDSTKYRNIEKHPRVSLLLDTRMDHAISDIKALTIEGKAFPVVEEASLAAFRARFLDRHPDLASFARQPDIVGVRVCFQAFLLLKGIQDIHYKHVGQ